MALTTDKPAQGVAQSQSGVNQPLPATTHTVLFLAQIPPPVHGAAVVSKRVYDILDTRKDVTFQHMWLGGAASLEDVGQKSVAKLFAFAWFLMQLAWLFVTGRRYAVAYLTFAPFSHAALRDGLLIAMSKLLAKRTLVHLHAEGLDEVMAGASLPQRLLRRMIQGAELISITEGVAASVRPTHHFKTVHLLPNCAADPGPVATTTSPRLRLGFLANLEPRKGVIRFLDCVETLQKAGLPVSGHIAGPSTSYLSVEQLRADIEQRGLTGIVEVLGPIYGDAKIKFLRGLDAFLYLSQRDYFPLVVIEAMSCGVVPIVFDHEGVRELVGPDFSANVISTRTDPLATVATAAGIARGYCANPEKLAQDKVAARQHYLARYTEDRFLETFNAILDGSSSASEI